MSTSVMPKKTMSLCYWIAKAIAFSENDNDVTISACYDSPELAYQRLVTGMKELQLVPADWDE